MKIPPAIIKLINPLMAALLKSRFHGQVSKSIMLIRFTGRKTGREYETPISYVQEGRTVRCFTDSPWWRNLRGGAPVSVRIRGEDHTGRAQPVEDDTKRIADALSGFLAEVPGDAPYYDLELNADGRPEPADLQRAAECVTLIEITLD